MSFGQIFFFYTLLAQKGKVFMDFNCFSSILWKVQHTHSRHQRSTSKFQTSLELCTLTGRLRVSNE